MNPTIAKIVTDQVERDTFGWVTDYDRETFVMSPDADEAWADGFRDAHVHVLGHERFYAGSWLRGMVNAYQSGYLAGVQAIITFERYNIVAPESEPS